MVLLQEFACPVFDSSVQGLVSAVTRPALSDPGIIFLRQKELKVQVCGFLKGAEPEEVQEEVYEGEERGVGGVFQPGSESRSESGRDASTSGRGRKEEVRLPAGWVWTGPWKVNYFKMLF